MIYVVRNAPSKGARLLAEKLKERGVEARHVKQPPPFLTTGDKVIRWGARADKLAELQVLHAKGVPTPAFSTTAPTGEGWLARTANHKGGQDLLFPKKVRKVAFYVEKLPLVQEFRVHVIDGKSVRVGMKVAVNPKAHPWIRSRRAGWHISYGADAQAAILPLKGVRTVARKAVEALELKWAAVDVGVTEKGKPYVLEVNRAPGLDNMTALKYAEKLVGGGDGSQQNV